MGYGSYVIDGKVCGYTVADVCNEDGCDTEIDRGLAYACGGSPGDYDGHCGGYFCADHLFFAVVEGQSGFYCQRCAASGEEE